MEKQRENKLKFKRLGIHTQYEHFVYMREDCEVCISEGFEALTRVKVSSEIKHIVASLNIIRTDLLRTGEISLSERAINAMGLTGGEILTVSHLEPVDSLSFVRSKIYGNEIQKSEMEAIISDIVKGNYSNVHLSAFITACAGDNLNTKEIISLTEAMIASGEQIRWDEKMIVDKHCIGGLPGNRTTPIIVSIAAAFGLKMPKTSSRAITSPAGTADTMEVLSPVNLTKKQIKSIVNKEGACIAWGGTANLSPADDIFIRIERALDIDSEGQLIASVLSKKIAAGSTHVIIDMPVGPTAKLRSVDAATHLKIEMEKVAQAIGLKLKVIITDGSQAIGKGIGPALEARDLLAVLRNEEHAPSDLRNRALLLAGELLELSGEVEQGSGDEIARDILYSGKAYDKFLAICKAQGGFREPGIANFKYEVKAEYTGKLKFIDNRKLAKLAKLAGAPDDKKAGVDFLVTLEEQVQEGQVMYVVHAESKGELAYALDYQKSQRDILIIE